MGADAVAMASAPLMALGCQRYRICNSGMCPMGIATQDPELEARLDQEAGAVRVGNFLNALNNELRTFLRVSGHTELSELSLADLCTTSSEISEAPGIRHAGCPPKKGPEAKEPGKKRSGNGGSGRNWPIVTH